MLPDIKEIMRDELRVCVQKGAVWLDEYEPKWVEKIVPDNLDISSGAMCICGQVFGDYGNRPDAVSYEPWKYGFTVDLEDTPFRIDCDCQDGIPEDCEGYVPSVFNELAWRILDELWLDEVYWRVGK